MKKPLRILYCHCAYAKVVPPEVKRQVLEKLCASGVSFEAVSDLCEMSARKDSALKRLADGGSLRIAACFPRAVKWLFHAGGAPLSNEGVEVVNMRELSGAAAATLLLDGCKCQEQAHEQV